MSGKIITRVRQRQDAAHKRRQRQEMREWMEVERAEMRRMDPAVLSILAAVAIGLCIGLAHHFLTR